ncbi:hypothetical protein ANAPH1_00359 [Anaplasma phagocytophilum]|nr:hypothetical protein ANAPH1_00359 [Anaplasma phagocytophilum]
MIKLSEILSKIDRKSSENALLEAMPATATFFPDKHNSEKNLSTCAIADALLCSVLFHHRAKSVKNSEVKHRYPKRSSSSNDVLNLSKSVQLR